MLKIWNALTFQKAPLPAFLDKAQLTALQEPFHGAWPVPAQTQQLWHAKCCHAIFEGHNAFIAFTNLKASSRRGVTVRCV